MKVLYDTTCKILEQGENLVLATILSKTGSTPRMPGTRMIIRQNGKIHGTIGGGLLEAETIKTASEIFKTAETQIRTFNLNAEMTDKSLSMLCGGCNEIFFELVEATDANIRVFRTLNEYRRHGKECVLVTVPDRENGNNGPAQRFCITRDGTIPSTCPFSQALINELIKNAGRVNTSVIITIENRRFVIEPSVAPKIVYLFGAGHVSKQVALLADIVNFQVSVIDDREEFANKDRFAQAREIKVLSSFENAFTDLEINQNSFIVIVTRGHAHDKSVLKQALKSKAGYIGMIGSRKKRDAIYDALLNQGFTDKDLDRVHSPIGLGIGADTPEEIGVSIVAELIRVRAGMA